MVDAFNITSELARLFKDEPEVFANYLLSSSKIALILLDSQGNILNCSKYFQENTQLPHKPVGQSIEKFIHNGYHLNKNMANGNFEEIKLSFLLKDSIDYSMDGHIIRVNDHFIVFVNTFYLTDKELIASMSKMTDELTDITRKLNKKNRQLNAANETITKLMHTDPLTGLANRRHLSETLKREMSGARRHGHPLCIIMADIDHFKSINDSFGHDNGDKVLASVANILLHGRDEDFAARYGGEEFLVLLPGIPIESALQYAERIRKTVENTIYPGIDRKITISLGATLFLSGDTEESFIKRADLALYEAKESGRNRVVLK